MASPLGFEPRTLALEEPCSNPTELKGHMAPHTGFEPASPFRPTVFKTASSPPVFSADHCLFLHIRNSAGHDSCPVIVSFCPPGRQTSSPGNLSYDISAVVHTFTFNILLIQQHNLLAPSAVRRALFPLSLKAC